ncbi:MFS transporter [Leucobacter sp. USCH14]|uniref:MFS transporter n=1 Tax=Leucobacter sp. USCH14 TaxID=3024838 RepID=UPI0030B753B6
MALETEPARIRGRGWVIAALVCGSFGIGISEFVVMGLLPQIAADLIPERFAVNPDAAVASAGNVVSFYALGVVVGLVVTPIALHRLSLRTTLLVCAAAMFAWTACTSFSPTLPLTVLLRFLSSLTHASYVGLAAILVGRMLGVRYQGRGASLVLGGFALANLLGVPLGTVLGSNGDWRLVLLLCSALFLVPIAALLMSPRLGSDHARLRGDEAVRTGSVGQIGVLLVVGTGLAIGAFMLVTYVAPVVEQLQGVGHGAGIPVAVFMLLFGIGMNIGNFGGGWLTDVSAELTFALSAASGVVAAALLSIPCESGATAIAGMLLIGVSLGSYSPAIQILFVTSARRWPKVAASFTSGTTNLGSFLGAAIGGFALSASGAHAVSLVALVLLAVGAAAQTIRMRTHPVTSG